jgi:hypothetical protein
MEVFKLAIGVFGGTIGVTFLAWLIVHFNGKTLLGILDLISYRVGKLLNSSTIKRSWLKTATAAEVVIIGLTPIAIASLVSTSQGNCYSSINSFLIAEVIIICLCLLIPQHTRRNSNFLGEQYYRNNLPIFAIAIIWCLVFTVWGLLAIEPEKYLGVDRFLINQNGDMWFYIRRYAAYTVDNLRFDNQPACFFLQISPKKLSSFIGSIIIYFTPSTVFGITLFQGLLGCSLFLSLFGNWYNFTYQGKRLSTTATISAIFWAIFSPPVFWLIISSYLSNALFITIFVLGLTAARRICLQSKRYPWYAKYAILFCFVVNIFAFYLVTLPIALLFFLATLVIYRYELYLKRNRVVINLSRILLAAGLSILLCCMAFPHQLNLTEVTDNLNALREHGKNFVPLNPWSLVQEKPNPMPNIKDFGVWFNIVVGTLFSGWILKIIYHKLNLKNTANSIYSKDLIAAASVIGVYLVYLLAYIPLEYTYRLGKLAVSIIYPLAILGILPTVLWFRDRFYRHQSGIFKIACTSLLALHIILHIDKTLYLRALPVGKYEIVSSDRISTVNSLTILNCQEYSESRKYQKIIGLDLARQYPELTIDVITSPHLMTQTPHSEAIVRGMDAMSEGKNLCLFEVKL